MSRIEDAIKLFGITNQLIEHDLDRIELEYALDLRRGHMAQVSGDDADYPQIEREIRVEAASMAPHYEVFYSLETTIRRLVADALEDEEGDGWWGSTRIPDSVRQSAEKARRREIDSGTTPRSEEPIAFITFGELGELIKCNWDIFGAYFSSVRAVERVLANLNTLRGPIAHCSPLAPDEVVRLRLAVSDWFRLMG
ncbi:MAG: Swt1 family HEPN domain-containing protein [Conexibacter sp.]